MKGLSILPKCTLDRFIKGFITRNEPVNKTNARFQQLVKCEYLMRLSRSLPTNLLDKRWIAAPSSCSDASAILYVSHNKNTSSSTGNICTE